MDNEVDANNEKTLFLLDSYGLIYRCYYAMLQKPLANSRGQNMSAVYGFFRNLFSILQAQHPKYIAAAMDSRTPTFRHKKFSAYKATRKPTPPELKAQFPIIEEILSAFRIPTLRVDGYEADDVLATLAKAAERENFFCQIMTSDKDLLQLSNGVTRIFLPDRSTAWSLATDDDISKKWGVRPDQIHDYLSLVGDAADNVRGVEGIGAKRAVKLLDEYGSLQGIYKNLKKLSESLQEKLVDGKKDALLAYELIELNCEVPLDTKMENFHCNLDIVSGAELLEKYEMPALAKKFRAIAETGGDSVPKANAHLADTFKNLKKSSKIAVYFDFSEEGDVEKLERFSIATSSAKCLHFNPENIVFLKDIFEDENLSVCIFDGNRVSKFLRGLNMQIKCNIRDEKLAAWLLQLDISDFSFLRVYANVLDENIAHNAAAIFRMDEIFSARMAEAKMTSVFENIELPLISILLQMEDVGIHIDRAVLEAKEKLFANEIESLKNEIFSLVGHKFDILSYSELKSVLFDELKMPCKIKANHEFSATDTVLIKLSKISEIPAKVLAFFRLYEFYVNYIKTIADAKTSNDRIKIGFDQFGPAGDILTHNPNLHDLPIHDENGRHIRSIFTAEQGKSLIHVDFAQFWTGIFARVSGEKALEDAFLSGADMHKFVASKLFQVDMRDVTEKQRRTAKAITFAVITGQSDITISRELNTSMLHARTHLKNFFVIFANVANYVENAVKSAQKRKCASSMFGRVRLTPLILSSTKMIATANQRIAVSAPVQCAAIDLIKLTMIRLNKLLEGTDCRMLLQIHDEFLFECDEKNAGRYAKMIREEMEKMRSDDVPKRVDVSIGKSWGEFH